MKIPFQPLPDGEEPHTVKEFLFRLQHDPGFAGTMQRHYEAALALPAGPDTADMQRQARAALKALKHHQGAWLGMQALKKGQALMEDPHEPCDPDLMARLEALAREAVDHLLDVQEPERTRIMASATGILAHIREIRARG